MNAQTRSAMAMVAGSPAAGGSALISLNSQVTPRRRPDSSAAARMPAKARSRESSRVSRRSISIWAKYGTLLIAPGSIRHTPVVPTVSGLPLSFAPRSTASAISAAASEASWRTGIRTAPACPPSPRRLTR